MWLRHFGKPLVPTVTNFGRNGKPPLNQALLDWLAVQFMDDNWSMKKVHRIIVTSHAYRMVSSGTQLSASNQKIDPENNSFWHMNPRRLEAEVVRDTALYLADVDGLVSFRRSVYLRHSPENQVEFLKLYDQPNPTDCYMRTESVIPQQALASTNSTLTLEAARSLGRKLASRAGCHVSRTGTADPLCPETGEPRRSFIRSQAPCTRELRARHAQPQRVSDREVI
jgi:hypothetical protein